MIPACHQIDGVIANQNQAVREARSIVNKLLLLAEFTWYVLCHDEPGDDQH